MFRSNDVTVVNVDTDASPWDAGTVGSRGNPSFRHGIQLAAIDARNQIFKMAARQLEASPDDLEIVDRQIRVRGTPAKSVSLATSPPTRTPSSAKSSAVAIATTWN